MTFKEKVQSMTAKEIIMAMVDSLIPPPLIKIQMSTFGGVAKEKYGLFNLRKRKICVGCAATNTICRISGITFNIENITTRDRRSIALETDCTFLFNFEAAIDYLRQGEIDGYNSMARAGEFAQINSRDIQLWPLENNYTREHLDAYIELANAQE